MTTRVPQVTVPSSPEVRIQLSRPKDLADRVELTCTTGDFGFAVHIAVEGGKEPKVMLAERTGP